MAPAHGTDGESLTQALLDDSDFLRRIVERMLQQVIEAEMTAHVVPIGTSAPIREPVTAMGIDRGRSTPG